MKTVRIGDLLVEYGYATLDQVEEGLAYQKDHKVRLGEAMLELGYINETQLNFALAKSMGIEQVDLTHYPIDDYAVGIIPKEIALRYNIIAISQDGSTLTVATSDPLDLYALEEVRLVTNMQTTAVVALKEAIKEAIEVHYSQVDALSAASSANENAKEGRNFLEDLMSISDDNESPVVRLLNSLLLRAYNTNVSDIHIEPYETETVIRLRRDGMLLPYITLSPALHQGLVARTKILAQMDIAEKRKPQDGHFKITLEGIEINVRVSFIPTVYGEKGVLRLLTTNIKVDHKETFGMNEANYNKTMEILKNPHGIIYLTGPTGSGKSTTLYAILEHLSQQPVNIATIEDPVEKTVPKINQTQVNERAGVTFETGLRSLLRQDPDVIMIGETRDVETATISARSAMTGHLVLSTLHTNDAVSSVVRLQDMGLPAYMVASSVVGIVAQRLVRKVCPYCGEEYEATDSDMKILYGSDAAKHDRPKLKKGKGCFQCSDTGYKGRIAIHEIVAIDKQMRHLISSGASTDELTQYAVDSLHMSTLRDEAKKLVLDGLVSIEEMNKITYSLD